MNPTQAKGFNLSLWAINNPALTPYLMGVLRVLGVASYFILGHDNDPPSTHFFLKTLPLKITFSSSLYNYKHYFRLIFKNFPGSIQ